MTESVQVVADKLSPDTPELVQLAMPEPVSMWPVTLAWKLVFGAVLVAVLFYLFKRYRDFQKARWKRQAFTEALQCQALAQADAWFVLIKRVHLVHHTKSEVGRLSDAGLLEALSNQGFNEQALVDELLQAHYQPQSRISDQASQALYKAFIAWVTALLTEKTYVE